MSCTPTIFTILVKIAQLNMDELKLYISCACIAMIFFIFLSTSNCGLTQLENNLVDSNVFVMQILGSGGEIEKAETGYASLSLCPIAHHCLFTCNSPNLR